MDALVKQPKDNVQNQFSRKKVAVYKTILSFFGIHKHENFKNIGLNPEAAFFKNPIIVLQFKTQNKKSWMQYGLIYNFQFHAVTQ